MSWSIVGDDRSDEDVGELDARAMGLETDGAGIRDPRQHAVHQHVLAVEMDENLQQQLEPYSAHNRPLQPSEAKQLERGGGGGLGAAAGAAVGGQRQEQR